MEEKEQAHTGINMSPGDSARTPIVINGGTNNITIIETQNNDSSAVKALESRDRIQEVQYKMIESVVETFTKISADFLAKKQAEKVGLPNVNKPSKFPTKKRKSKKRK